MSMSAAKFQKLFVFFLIAVMTVSVLSGSKIYDVSAAVNPKFGVSTSTSLTSRTATVSASVLNVRASNSTGSSVIGKLARGASVYILADSKGWYKISYNGKTGWVSGQYLKNIRAVNVKSDKTTSAQSRSSSAPKSTSSAAEKTSSSPAPASSSASSSSAPTSSSVTSSSSASSPMNAKTVPTSSLPSKISAGYYTSWSAYSGYTPSQINALKLNVVHYAFAGIGSNLKIAVGDSSVDYTNFTKLNALKKSYPALKTLISVGGWDGSSRFSDMALTDSTRRAFAGSCVSFIKQYGFDGIDIDWEYPVSGGSPGRPEDKGNFTLLMKSIREALTAQGISDGKYYYLTFAGGASNGYINNVQLSLLSGYVDYAVDMTYDLHGPWDAYTDFNAPLYTPGGVSPQYKISVDSSLRSWRSAGFPSGKLVMGVPFYGYVYSGVNSANNGLYQKFTSAKSIGYDSIVSSYLNNPLYTKLYQSTGQVPYLFGNGKFISYDDAASIAAKTRYVSANGLRGVSAWELSYDRSSVLLGAVSQNLR
ncbi:MAG TPA: glycosyl hydrolase family 18 protein [Clostridia bacterium]|nr:glycosyl hydrolase family 18 protein [Clostridia bacterium]